MNTSVRIAAIAFVSTLILLVLKLVVGIISGSIAVVSDALDSASDLVAGGAALISVRVAAWPADESHPYGHGKIESLSASASAGVVAVGGGFVVYQAVRRLVEGSPEINVALALAPMLLAAALNQVLAVYMRRQARRAHSLALASEATHLQTNVVQAGTVVAGLALVGATGERVFDPLVALGLAVYMGWTAVRLIRDAVGEIMDVALPDEELRIIHDVILAHRAEVRGFHRLRSRRSGPHRQVDMHLLVDPHRTVEEVHTVCDSIEREIHDHLPGTEVTIHMEPDDGRYRGPLERMISGGAGTG